MYWYPFSVVSKVVWYPFPCGIKSSPVPIMCNIKGGLVPIPVWYQKVGVAMCLPLCPHMYTYMYMHRRGGTDTLRRIAIRA